ncbi:MAG: hypothetical protein DIU78_006725 [Pseudomonadota bacterium]|nr:MAG: hypothetical protein DIU78_02220 [Pseudomonadota bacterium]
MLREILTDRSDVLVRRVVLEPGEAMPWHTDPCRRFTVVVRGERIAIEFRDSGERITVPVHPGLADWDEPDPRVHRAVNDGTVPYEEVVLFFRDPPGCDPQPEHPGSA